MALCAVRNQGVTVQCYGRLRGSGPVDAGQHQTRMNARRDRTLVMGNFPPIPDVACLLLFGCGQVVWPKFLSKGRTMKIRNKLVAAGAATALALGGLIVAPSAAVAATAPTCVSVVSYDNSWWKPKWTVKIRNNCSTTQRVKIIWARAADTACTQLRPGQTLTSSRYTGWFDGIRKC